MTKLRAIPTCDLVDELEKREGVAHYCVEPHESWYELNIDNEEKEGTKPTRVSDSGPARILVVID